MLASRLESLLAEKPIVAIDFETADSGADSACSIGLVRIENWAIVDRLTLLIRPPRPQIWYTHIHGITWEMVKDAPLFDGIWPQCQSILDGAAAFAAHNASFDRNVLGACCRTAGIPEPALPFICTVQVAKRRWNQHPNNLKSVCRRLRIPLDHHNALSDAEACAKIILAAHPPRLFS